MVGLVDMQWDNGAAADVIREVIAFGCAQNPGAVQSAGAIVASESALHTHLPHLLDRAQIDQY